MQAYELMCHAVVEVESLRLTSDDLRRLVLEALILRSENLPQPSGFMVLHGVWLGLCVGVATCSGGRRVRLLVE